MLHLSKDREQLVKCQNSTLKVESLVSVKTDLDFNLSGMGKININNVLL